MVGDAPYGLALAAGVLAAVNPCGFALLPAYVSLLVVGERGTERPGPRIALGRAVALTAAMTAGFVVVFGGFGLLAAPAADWLAVRLPWLTIIIGIVLAALGLWLATGRDLPSPVPKLSRAPQLRRRTGSMVLFGISFAIASLGCTIGPFLGVVVAAFTTDTMQGLGLFLAYATGMATAVGTVAVAVALAQQTVITWMRSAAPVLSRAAGAVMTLAGAYVAWYGWYEIRILADPTSTDPIIDTAAVVQTRLATAIGIIGPLGIGIALAVLATALVLVWHFRARRNRSVG
jgi:cytochrome c biogenesis protein CcdA